MCVDLCFFIQTDAMAFTFLKLEFAANIRHSIVYTMLMFMLRALGRHRILNSFTLQWSKWTTKYRSTSINMFSSILFPIIITSDPMPGICVLSHSSSHRPWNYIFSDMKHFYGKYVWAKSSIDRMREKFMPAMARYHVYVVTRAEDSCDT